MRKAEAEAVFATINGESAELAPDDTIADLVVTRVGSVRGVAVARNGEVVPRSQWGREHICAGDQIEILTAAAGG
ncbi:MAG: sulfur carrier protein ThiS [Acidimicrobiales bacterium]|jgi:sulfur carrier protein